MPDSSGPEPIAVDTVRDDRSAKRKLWLTRLGIAVAIVAVVVFLYWLLIGSRHVSTDDAYVQADVAQVTALVAGPIVSAPVGDTRQVVKGQVLAVIDPVDYQLAVDRARAELGQAQRKVRGYQASDTAMAAQTNARVSDIAASQARLVAARADLARAQVDLTRRRNLAQSGAVSADELTVAQNQQQTAQAAVIAAQAAVAQARANAAAAAGERRAAQVLIEGAGVDDNPEVAVARAKLAQAELDLTRTTIRAPVTGLIARHAIEIGQRVPAGQALMTIVPIQTAYVDANFKEIQLRKIRIGSSVTLTSDVYGGSVKFHGKVTGIAGGSGSAFALIPAQNATGNWIKVVQRVPVRISLDPKELEAHPLRAGLSMKAEVAAS